LRTKDYYLSLVTIAFQFIFFTFVENMEWTGGPDGVRGITLLSIGGYSFNEPLRIFGFVLPYQTHFYYLAVILLILAVLITVRLRNSRVGLAWNAIREDEISAGCQGINLTRSKLAAFSVGALFAGVTGGVYTHYVGFISPNNFGFNLSVVLICMLIFGGMDNAAGVIVGTIILTILPERLREFSEYRMVTYGLVVVVMLVFRPQGLLPKRLRDYGRIDLIRR
jgi:branched-chain amino acid transport system permease protein